MGREDARAFDAVRRRAWAKTRREATKAARRSWRMNVNRLVIVLGVAVRGDGIK